MQDDSNKKSAHTRSHGFTLAEVLITLGIIGVVAAITVPTLLQNQRDKATVTAVKKAYSVLSQAVSSASQENGGSPDTWELDSTRVLSLLVPYLKITKDCTDGSQGCFPDVVYKYIGGNDYTNLNHLTKSKIRLADGTLIIGNYFSSECSTSRGPTLQLSNVCGEYWVDINGDKKPNTIGKDLFYFYLTKYGIVPLGTPSDTQTFNWNCKTALTTPSAQGWSCTAWVLYKENMDYLRCSDLDWNTKVACD